MYSITFWSGKHKIYLSKWQKYWSISECFFIAAFCTSSAINIFSAIPLSLDSMSPTFMITSERIFGGVFEEVLELNRNLG